MKLFSYDCNFILAEETERLITTPLGDVLTVVSIDGVPIDYFAENTYFLETGARIVSFKSNDFDAELLICRPRLHLPYGSSVTDCWAFLWRFQAISNVVNPKFIAHWNDNYLWNDSGSESGEHLDAMSFSNSTTKVVIGTQDGEVLLNRAKSNDLMPNNFDSIADPYTIVKYLKHGFEINVPCFYPNEICQIQFLIAWDDYSDTGTWFAVDSDPKNILENAGVK